MRILGRLLNNCRESDRQIGRHLGISGSAVNARIKKMQKGRVIEYFTLRIEPPLLGYGVFYIVVTGRDHDAILKQVRLVGQPFMIVPCVGGITICGIVVKEDVRQKIKIAEGLMKDVMVLNVFEAGDSGGYTSLTKTDIVIVSGLMDNPRQKIETLAKKISLSTKTVARSIEKMQKNDAVQFTLVYDPTRMTGYIPHVILTRIARDTKETIKRLKKKFAGNFLQAPYIAEDQIALLMYSDDIFGLDDLTQKVRDVPGVGSTDLFIPKKIFFPQEWIKGAVLDAVKSPTLHLSYQVN